RTEGWKSQIACADLLLRPGKVGRPCAPARNPAERLLLLVIIYFRIPRIFYVTHIKLPVTSSCHSAPPSLSSRSRTGKFDSTLAFEANPGRVAADSRGRR